MSAKVFNSEEGALRQRQFAELGTGFPDVVGPAKPLPNPEKPGKSGKNRFASIQTPAMLDRMHEYWDNRNRVWREDVQRAMMQGAWHDAPTSNDAPNHPSLERWIETAQRAHDARAERGHAIEETLRIGTRNPWREGYLGRLQNVEIVGGSVPVVPPPRVNRMPEPVGALDPRVRALRLGLTVERVAQAEMELMQWEAHGPWHFDWFVLPEAWDELRADPAMGPLRGATVGIPHGNHLNWLGRVLHSDFYEYVPHQEHIEPSLGPLEPGRAAPGTRWLSSYNWIAHVEDEDE